MMGNTYSQCHYCDYDQCDCEASIKDNKKVNVNFVAAYRTRWGMQTPKGYWRDPNNVANPETLVGMDAGNRQNASTPMNSNQNVPMNPRNRPNTFPNQRNFRPNFRPRNNFSRNQDDTSMSTVCLRSC